MANNDSGTIIERLKKSPIYNMSLNSKELFHSNFWGWLIEKYPEFSVIFLRNNDKKEKICRENDHRDIVIQTNSDENNIYIIENKIKSLPNKEQLAKYQHKEKNFKYGIITGLIDPMFEKTEFNIKDKKNNDIKCKIEKNTESKYIITCNEKEGTWEFMSYKKIVRSISEIMKRTKISGFDKQIIKEYCDVIKDINELIKEELGKNTEKLVFNENRLSEIRLDDIYKKLKMDNFAKYIREELSITNDIFIEQNFTNKNALFEIGYKKDDFKIGIQIQGEAYRRFVEDKVKDVEIYEKYVKDNNWFVSGDKITNKNNKTICFREEYLMTKMKNEFCKYKGKNNKNFVYQYWCITDNEGKNTYDELKKEIMADLEIAKRIYDKKISQ